MKYDFNAIEKHWQSYWDQHDTFRTPNPGEDDFDPKKPKYYVLDMFPYPSGVGLHVGHPLGYIATDIVARYKRMCGFNVLHPMGYDAFGLPAEQFAVEHGVHPRITTDQNIANMTRQLKRLGLSYDWNRNLATTDVDYYRWTQWIFLQLYRSWFDPVQQAARPIGELVAALESDRYYLQVDGGLVKADAPNLEAIAGVPIGLRQWAELPPLQRQQVIDENRLAYIDQVAVNWCPALGTVLANEEVTNEGRSERGNHPVFKRPLRQWMLRITAYAQRLIEDLDLVDWPESIKKRQRDWIGRSEGAMVKFELEGADDAIEIFTTRPDTLFGATYMVLAPEHPRVKDLSTDLQAKAIQQYQDQAAARTDVDRMEEAKVKTGVFTGSYAINPVNDERIPIWIADYVMMGYGTGAIMAVPAHVQRDHDFARTFDLPIHQVVTADALVDIRNEAYIGAGTNMHSANDEISLDGLSTAEAKQRITEWLHSKGTGRFYVQYKLRDWLFSRQRYWGEPFPIVHDPDGRIEGLEDSALPVQLPEMENFTPHASNDPNAPIQTPLSRAPDQWKYIDRNGNRCMRELNTMPQWAGSCWYYLRFVDPHNPDRFVSREAEQYWMAPSSPDMGQSPGGVDFYVGGVEHAVLHLLYARFWHKVLFDLGHVSTLEPFGRLYNQGYIQAYYYEDARKVRVPAVEVIDQDGRPAMEVQDESDRRFTYNGEPVQRRYGKMGKSLKNAIAPDEICEQYGCDTLRLYEMYLGPLNQSKIWNTRDIIGVHRFLQRLWRNFVDEETGELLLSDGEPDEMLNRAMHKTTKRVTDAMESMSFNVGIAALIEFNNTLVSLGTIPRTVTEIMVRLLAPFAPHIAEDLWSRLGHGKSLAHEPWPSVDPAMMVEETIEMPVQVNGKLRSRIRVPADADQQTVETAALEDKKILPHLEGKIPRKVIVITDRLVNIVVK